jgi:hypothetical protein
MAVKHPKRYAAISSEGIIFSKSAKKVSTKINFSEDRQNFVKNNFSKLSFIDVLAPVFLQNNCLCLICLLDGTFCYLLSQKHNILYGLLGIFQAVCCGSGSISGLI